MSEFTEDKQVACSCRASMPDEWTTVYAVDADPECAVCAGTGWWTRRTTYDRDPRGGFAKILREQRVT